MSAINMNMANDLQNYIKNTVVSMACCNKLDHRNYDSVKKPCYRLIEMTRNNSFDDAIAIIVRELLEHDVLNPDEDGDDEEEEEDDDDDADDKIFKNFIDYVGLYEMYNLHGDKRDSFKGDFINLLKKYKIQS